MYGNLTPKHIIETLAMQPHPEGGWYAETFRDPDDLASTAIYYLLEAGDYSHWHRVNNAAEVWHYYAGAPLQLTVSADGKGSTQHHLGTNLTAKERPQFVVPAKWWQSATSLGDWTLVGCTVAPGFDFKNFEMAPADWQPSANL